jgi:hypothetical protein
MNQGAFLIIRSRDEIARRLEYLGELLSEWDFTHPVSIKHGKYTNPRTLSQNALFHQWMAEASKQFTARGKKGCTPENLKLLTKTHLLGHVDIEVGSKTITVLRSTKKLDKAEFQHFMEEVEEWLIHQGIRLTIPGDSEFMRMREAQVA